MTIDRYRDPEGAKTHDEKLQSMMDFWNSRWVVVQIAGTGFKIYSQAFNINDWLTQIKLNAQRGVARKFILTIYDTEEEAKAAVRDFDRE